MWQFRCWRIWPVPRNASEQLQDAWRQWSKTGSAAESHGNAKSVSTTTTSATASSAAKPSTTHVVSKIQYLRPEFYGIIIAYSQIRHAVMSGIIPQQILNPQLMTPQHLSHLQHLVMKTQEYKNLSSRMNALTVRLFIF